MARTGRPTLSVEVRDQDRSVLSMPLPREVPESQKEAWDLYWSSNVANATDTVDLSLIIRLFRYRAELEESLDYWQGLSISERYEVQNTKFTVKRQTHPIAKRIQDLEKIVTSLENQVGLSPLSRARLGIELSNAELAWDEVRDRISSDVTTVKASVKEQPSDGTLGSVTSLMEAGVRIA